MTMVTGKVIDGKVVVEGDPLPDGATVRVLIPNRSGAYELSDEQRAELQEAIAEIERGEFMTGDELLAPIRRPISA